MTELKEKFFETFGIERKNRQYCKNGYCNRKPATKKFADDEICRNCNNGVFYMVPEITDHILLNLIVILSKNDARLGICTCYGLLVNSIDELKANILKDCIDFSKYIKDDVQKLFEE